MPSCVNCGAVFASNELRGHIGSRECLEEVDRQRAELAAFEESIGRRPIRDIDALEFNRDELNWNNLRRQREARCGACGISMNTFPFAAMQAHERFHQGERDAQRMTDFPRPYQGGPVREINAEELRRQSISRREMEGAAETANEAMNPRRLEGAEEMRAIVQLAETGALTVEDMRRIIDERMSMPQGLPELREELRGRQYETARTTAYPASAYMASSQITPQFMPRTQDIQATYSMRLPDEPITSESRENPSPSINYNYRIRGSREVNPGPIRVTERQYENNSNNLNFKFYRFRDQPHGFLMDRFYDGSNGAIWTYLQLHDVRYDPAGEFASWPCHEKPAQFWCVPYDDVRIIGGHHCKPAKPPKDNPEFTRKLSIRSPRKKDIL